MHIAILVTLGVSVVFTLLAVLGLINPKLGLSKSKEASLLRNGAIALIAYLIMALLIGESDPRQRIFDREAYRSASAVSSVAPGSPKDTP